MNEDAATVEPRSTLSPPIFVLGAPFSGKGLLGWALAQHPAIVHVTGNEWLARFAADLQVRYEVATHQGRRFKLDPLTIDRDRFYTAFGETLNQLILEGIAGTAPGVTQTTRWVDTTGGHSAAAPGLVRLFPEARFVHLVRDPEATVRGLGEIPASDGGVLPDEGAYQRWLEVTRECLELELAFGSERVLRVHYGDLTASPDATLRTICSFIGERFGPESIRPIEAAVGAESEPPPSRPVAGRQATAQRDAKLLMELLRREPPLGHGMDVTSATRVEERFVEAARVGTFDDGPHSLPAQIQHAVASVVPRDRTVVVVSKGDDELLAIDGRRALHFPQSEDGSYTGYHPGSSDEAIEHLEALRSSGASYLVIPAPSLWWLDHYSEFARHLLSKYQLVFYDPRTCIIFALGAFAANGATGLASLMRTAVSELKA